MARDPNKDRDEDDELDQDAEFEEEEDDTSDGQAAMLGTERSGSGRARGKRGGNRFSPGQREKRDGPRSR